MGDDIAGHINLSEARLTAILAQLISCLSYLEKKGCTLGPLVCSNIRVDLDGNLKIGWSIRPLVDENCRALEQLSRLTMKLMQGYEKQAGIIGLDQPKCWSLEAVTFLSDTTSASSVQELVGHELFVSVTWGRWMLAELCREIQQ